jgi:hypothetical protein
MVVTRLEISLVDRICGEVVVSLKDDRLIAFHQHCSIPKSFHHDFLSIMDN